jgi:hypothetical protein
MSSKNGKSSRNFALSVGVAGGLILTMGLGKGNSESNNCGVDTSYVSFKIDALLKSRMDTATAATRLGIQIDLQYPSDRSIMRITDSGNQEGVQCTGPDTVLEAYWQMVGARLANDYDLYPSDSANAQKGLRGEFGGAAAAYASKSTILAISQECFVTMVRASPPDSQPWVGLRPFRGQRLPNRRQGEFNLLGRRLLGPLGVKQPIFLPMLPE